LARIFLFGQPFTYAHLVEIGRLGVGFIGFFLAIAFAFHNQRFAKLLILAFLANIVLVVFLFFPTIDILRLLLVVSPVSYTFLGFQNSTIALGASVVITLVFLFAIYQYAKRGFYAAFLFFMCCLMAAILLWSGSRAAWLAAAVAMVAVVAFRTPKDPKQMARGLFAMGIMFLIAFTLASPIIRNTALTRLFPRLDLQITVDKFLLRQLPTREFVNTNDLVFDVNFEADRGGIWKFYGLYAIGHPLGMGPVYYVASPFGPTMSAHDTWLQLAMSGGILALILAAILLAHLGSRLFRAARGQPDLWNVALFAVFCGVIITMTFIDSLDFRWVWTLFGLMLAWNLSEKENFRTGSR
jgi:hypothetical protein